MSWDLFVYAENTEMDVDASGVVRFPDEWEPGAIGTPAEVRQRLSDVFPDTYWSDLTWGSLDASDYSLEFAIGAEDPVRSLTIFARGNATPAALRLLEATGWKIFDTWSGKWLNGSPDPEEGLTRYQERVQDIVARAPRPRGWIARLLRR